MMQELGTAFRSVKTHFQSYVHVHSSPNLTYNIATNHEDSQEKN